MINYYAILKKLKCNIQKHFKEIGIEPQMIGAVCLNSKGHILSIGYNSFSKTHPRMLINPEFPNYKVYLHAECSAIYNLNYTDIEKVSTILVCRLNRIGLYRIAKPCIGCTWEIKQLPNLNQVLYTNDLGELILMDIEKV